MDQPRNLVAKKSASKGGADGGDALSRENALNQSYRLEQAVVTATMAHCAMADTPEQADNYSKGIGRKVAAARELEPQRREAALAQTLLVIYKSLSSKLASSKEEDFPHAARGVRKAADVLADSYVSISAHEEFRRNLDSRISFEKREADSPISRTLTAVMGEKYPEQLRQSIINGQVFAKAGELVPSADNAERAGTLLTRAREAIRGFLANRVVTGRARCFRWPRMRQRVRAGASQSADRSGARAASSTLSRRGDRACSTR